ncbi:MAG: alpha/beta fold hydrolase [Planctomycetes bacterium]|nr:alpha/beta fold hydrolase [Planctomycetota bacterium]
MPEFEYKGHKIFYREAGAGAPLVILHGNTASSAMHEDEIAHFAQAFHVVAPDLIGCGRSRRVATWPKHWWLESAHLAAALVGKTDEGRAVLVGTSGGAIAAILAAIEHPQLVRAVVADSFGRGWTPAEIDAVLADRSRCTVGQMAFWQKAHGDDWHNVVEADSAMIRSWHDTGIEFFEDRLGRVKCPVLITASVSDNLVPRIEAQARRTAAEIAD